MIEIEVLEPVASGGAKSSFRPASGCSLIEWSAFASHKPTFFLSSVHSEAGCPC